MSISDLYDDILYRESRGRRYDNKGNLLQSSAGALGEWQVMPATAHKPGFGITPAKDDSPDELARVGKEYAAALYNKYGGDQKLAMMAYNWGPGAVDKWLASGADPSRIPEETRRYVQGIEGGRRQVEPQAKSQVDKSWRVELLSGKKYTVQAPTPELAWDYASQYEEEMLAQQPKPSGGIMSDLGKSLKSGAYGLAQLPSNVYGIATGDYNALGGEYLRGKQQEIQQSMSPEYQEQQLQAQAAIAEAEKQGEVSGFLESAKQHLTRPRLLSGMVAENVPNLALGLGAGKAASMGTTALARRGLSGVAAEEAAKAAAKSAATAGARTSMGTMATMQGGDVAQQTYQDVLTAARGKGYSEEDAQRIAGEEARKAGLMAGALSYGTMAKLPGAESMMFKGVGAKTALGGAAKGFAGEFSQEALEEGGGRVLRNLGVQTVDPNQEWSQGVGATMAQAGILGGLMGGPMGGLNAKLEAVNEQRIQQYRDLQEQARRAAEQGEKDKARELLMEANRIAQGEATTAGAHTAADQATSDFLSKMNSVEGIDDILKNFNDYFPTTTAEEKAEFKDHLKSERKRIAAQQGREQQLAGASAFANAPVDENGVPLTTAQQEAAAPKTITEEQLRAWGFNKNTRVFKNLVGKDLANPDDVAFINAALSPLMADPEASPNFVSKLQNILDYTADIHARYGPQEQAAPEEQTAETEPEEQTAEAAPEEQTETKPEAQAEPINAELLAQQQEKVRKDAEWAQRMSEQAAVALAQQEHDAKRNAETAAKLANAYTAAQEASRARAEKRAAERAEANGWAEAERQRALDEEFIVEDTKNKEAFAQAAAGTQGELTGIGAQPAEQTQAGAPSLNDLVEQYIEARSRVNSDPNAEYEMQDISELGKELYGKAWTQAKYNATSRAQGKLDFTGKQAEEKPAPKAETAAETKPEPAQEPAAPEFDAAKLLSDLQAISAREGNSDIGKRARLYIQEARQGTADVAPAVAFAEEHAAPKKEAKPKAKKKAPEAAPVEKTLADYENELAEEDAKDEPSKAKIKALERKITDLKVGRKKATKADVEEAVSADRVGEDVDAAKVTEGDQQWEQFHELLSGETTLLDALNVLLQIPNLSQNQRALINALARSKAVQTATFSVVSEDRFLDGESQTGGYDPATNHVSLYNKGGLLTTLHEAVHSAIYGAIESDKQFKAQIEELFNKAKEYINPRDYGLTNVQEFAAEAMSNPAFQKLLSEIPSTGKIATAINNLWRKFVDATRSLLGLQPDQNTLLDDVMSLLAPRMTGEFIPTNKPQAPSIARTSALNTLDNMSRVVAQPSTQTTAQQIDAAVRSIRNITPASAMQAYVSMADKFRTKYVSGNTAFINAVRRELMAQGRTAQEITGFLIQLSDSQALHSEALAHEFLLRGGLEFDTETERYKAVDKTNNFKSLHTAVDALRANHGFTQEESDALINAALEARRIDSIRRAGNPNDVLLHMTPEQVAQGMSLFQTIPELRTIAAEWDGIRKNTINLLKETGVYSERQAEAYLDSVGYVPFYRDQNEVDAAGDPIKVLDNIRGRADSLRVKKEKTLKGSELGVHDIVHNMERWVMFGVDRAVKNAQAVRMIDFAKENMHEGFVTQGRQDDPNAVRILRDGKFEYYNLQDPLYAAAFNSMSNMGLKLPKLAVSASNLLRQTVVLNPLFGLSQVSQDAMAAMFTSGLSPRYALKIPARAISEFVKTLFNKSAAHEALKKFGAVGVPDASATMSRIDAEVEAGLRKLDTKGLLMRSLRKFSMASDNAVRQAVWSLAKEQGLTNAEALEKAFEIINFRRHGAESGLIRTAAQLVPFMNAYIQAMNVAYKTVTGEGISPAERKSALLNLAHVTGMVMAMSVVYAMLNGDDEDYLNKDAAVRDRLLMIPGTGMSIPLRNDIFLLPKLLAEHTYLLLTDNATEDGAKMRKSLGHALVNAVTGPTPAPQVIKPFLEVGLNHNFFTGRDLIGAHQKRMATSEQVSMTTSELGKLLGKTGLVSPIAADHIIRGVFGSVGGATTWASNVILSSEPGRSRPDTSTWDLLASMPGMGQFMTKEVGTGLKTDFYDLKNQVDEVVSTFNDLKGRNPEKARDYVLDPDRLKLFGMGSAMNQINKSLTEIRNAEKIIFEMKDTDLSPEQKMERIRELKLMEQRIMQAIDVKRLRAMGGM